MRHAQCLLDVYRHNARHAFFLHGNAHELLGHSNQVSLKELSACNHYTILDAVFGEQGYWLSHVASLTAQ